MPVSAVPNVQKPQSTLPGISHPHYKKWFQNWYKWRLTYEGGDRFIVQYLVKFSNREDNKDFFERRRLTYCPAFAKSSIQEIRNAIYKRAKDITRVGGTASYQDATAGRGTGVDLIGSDMSHFMCIKVLEELLIMGTVGIYVDMPSYIGSTLLEKGKKRPYIYLYQAEDIKSWTYDTTDNPNEFSAVLLTDHVFDYDQETGLPSDEIVRYRYVYLKDTDEGRRVFCRFCRENGEYCDEDGYDADEFYEIQLGNLEKIPFVKLDISHSLLMDAANYQIAHLNLASSDIWYSCRANFPFYIEPYDPKSQSPYIKKEGESEFDETDFWTMETTTQNASEVVVGPTRGRKYPTGTNQPAFIHPSTEPMQASMAKQEQLKRELRQLINLSLATLDPSNSSAESKEASQQGLENGLSYVSRVMQWAETRIGYYWSIYEGSGAQPQIDYPEQYEILSPDEIQKEIESLAKLIDRTTSMTLKRRCMKIIAELKVSSYVTREELDKIRKEIDNADVVIADPLSIQMDLQNGLVSNAMASEARGYPKGQADAAAQDHADRLERIQSAQTTPDPAARGLNDLSGDPTAGSKEKAAVKDQTKEPNPGDPTRGPGQNNE